MTTTPDWQREIDALDLPKPVTTANIGAAVGIGPKEGKGGDFATVTSLIRPDQLRNDVKFNPTPPIVQYRALAEATNFRPNQLGFLVRDPVFMSQVSGVKADNWNHWGTNYGFRFMYNPTEFTESLVAPAGGDPMMMLRDVQMGAIPSSVDTGSGINMSLLLYRGEDLALLSRSDFTDFYANGGMSSEQRDDILQRGTQSDLEYLFRMCNGDPLDTWRGVTSDWGMLLPTLLVLSVGYSSGNRKIRGRLSNLSWSHRLFAPGMVPILTEVSVQFTRQSDNYYQAEEEPVAATTDDSGDDSDSAGKTKANDSVNYMPVFDGEMRTSRVGRTPEQAVRWLLKNVGMRGVTNACLRIADDAYNPKGGRLPRAIDQWYRAEKAGYGHPKARDYPPGAQLFWWSSNPARHVATYVGDGYVVSNVGDVLKREKVSYFDNNYGRFIGWAEPYYGG